MQKQKTIGSNTERLRQPPESPGHRLPAGREPGSQGATWHPFPAPDRHPARQVSRQGSSRRS